MPSTKHFPCVALLDEDASIEELLELDGAFEAGATLDAGLEGAGDPPPPPPPQAVNSNVMPRQTAPFIKLAGLFIRTPIFIILIYVNDRCNRLPD
jgi:hypothetical protein